MLTQTRGLGSSLRSPPVEGLMLNTKSRQPCLDDDVFFFEECDGGAALHRGVAAQVEFGSKI
jgi:hypothetical protein